jgi:flagellar biosynthesis protein FlhB
MDRINYINTIKKYYDDLKLNKNLDNYKNIFIILFVICILYFIIKNIINIIAVIIGLIIIYILYQNYLSNKEIKN